MLKLLALTLLFPLLPAVAGAEPADGENILETTDNRAEASAVDENFLQQMKGEVKTRDGESAQTRFAKEDQLLRLMPNLKAGSLHTIKLGDRLELISFYEDMEAATEEESMWARVRIPGTQNEGYVYAKDIQETQPEIPQFKTRKPLAYVAKDYYVSASSLRMRDEPNLAAYSVANIPHGEKVQVLRFSEEDEFIDGISARWAYVRWDGNDGWVFSGYLDDELAPKGTMISDEDPGHIHKGSSKYVRPKLLHVRDEPSRFGTVIGTIPHGEDVRLDSRSDIEETVVGLKSIWVKVSADGTSGWVFGGFLSDRRDSYLASDDIDVPFIYPLDSDYMRRMGGYGPRIHPVLKTKSFHTGVDVAAPRGVEIHAAGSGTIIYAEKHSIYGNLIKIEHDNGYITYYAHQSVFLKKPGDKVNAGDIIGEVGNTGRSTGPHLHFEVRTPDYNPVNPKEYIPPVE